MPLILWLILGTPAVIWFLGTDMPGVTEFSEAAAELIGESFGLLGERVDEFANFLQRAVRTAILALFGMVLFAMILPNQDIHWTLPLYFWHPQITIWCSRTTVIPTLVLALVGYLAWIVTRGHVLLGILAVELVPSKTPLVGKIAALGKKLLRKVQLYLGLIVVFGIVLSIVPLSNDFSLVPLFAATIIARIFLGKGKLRGILTITMVGFVLVFFMGGRGPAKKNFGKFTDSGNPADLFSADISHGHYARPVCTDQADRVIDLSDATKRSFVVDPREGCFGTTYRIPETTMGLWSSFIFQAVESDTPGWMAIWPQNDHWPQPSEPFRTGDPHKVLRWLGHEFRFEGNQRILVIATGGAVSEEANQPNLRTVNFNPTLVFHPKPITVGEGFKQDGPLCENAGPTFDFSRANPEPDDISVEPGIGCFKGEYTVPDGWHSWLVQNDSKANPTGRGWISVQEGNGQPSKPESLFLLNRVSRARKARFQGVGTIVLTKVN